MLFSLHGTHKGNKYLSFLCYYCDYETKCFPIECGRSNIYHFWYLETNMPPPSLLFWSTTHLEDGSYIRYEDPISLNLCLEKLLTDKNYIIHTLWKSEINGKSIKNFWVDLYHRNPNWCNIFWQAYWWI